MPGIDRSKYFSDTMSGPSRAPFAIVPRGSAELSVAPKAFYVGTGGTVVPFGIHATAEAVFKNVSNGQIIDVRARCARATGTTAGDIVGMARCPVRTAPGEPPPPKQSSRTLARVAVKHTGTAVAVWDHSATTKAVNAEAQDVATFNSTLNFSLVCTETNDPGAGSGQHGVLRKHGRERRPGRQRGDPGSHRSGGQVGVTLS